MMVVYLDGVPLTGAVIELDPDPVDGRDPGDDLEHRCAAHPYEESCDGLIGCVSFCGIGLDGWEELDDGEEEHVCIVCTAMWEALPDA